MQTDMHFYGTYAMARAAGIPQQDSKTVAYAAQFVDDSTQQDSESHEDGGLLYGIATAHHAVGAAFNSAIDREEQRRVWVPFHFIPGGQGDSLEEKLICTKDSSIVNAMMTHHVQYALGGASFGLPLLGIGAHVYMDTFSHYGFSGISSDYNAVDGGSFEFIGLKNREIGDYIEKKKEGFFSNFGTKVVSFVGESMSGALGHGGVATFPDRPFLHWRVSFDKSRPGNGKVSDRNNPSTFLEGCGKLHAYLSKFAKNHYAESSTIPFDSIKDRVKSILSTEGKKPERIEQWLSAIQEGVLFPLEEGDANIAYDHEEWEDQKNKFHELRSSSQGLETPIYRFHQAAALHRYYVLKELLPENGIAVY